MNLDLRTQLDALIPKQDPLVVWGNALAKLYPGCRVALHADSDGILVRMESGSSLAEVTVPLDEFRMDQITGAWARSPVAFLKGYTDRAHRMLFPERRRFRFQRRNAKHLESQR